jgi:hypothetical protein
MVSDLLPITEDDIPVICNYINDEGELYNKYYNRAYCSNIIENTLHMDNVVGYKIEKDNIIVAFLVFKIEPDKNILEHFFIAKPYRAYRSVMVPMHKKLIDTFKNQELIFYKLHDKVDAITKYTDKNNKILLDKLEIKLLKIKGVHNGK